MYFSEIGFRLFFRVMVENKEEVCYTDTIFRQLKEYTLFCAYGVKSAKPLYAAHFL